MSEKYNFIYSKLVKEENDVVGIIAYGIYKHQKIEFISKIKEDEQREPTPEEIKAFSTMTNTDSQLQSYRYKAETMLSELVGNVADEELSRYEDEMLHNYKDSISSCLPSKWSSFRWSVFAGVVSTLLFGIVAGVFYFLGETSDKSYHEKVEGIIEELNKSNSQDPDTLKIDKNFKGNQ